MTESKPYAYVWRYAGEVAWHLSFEEPKAMVHHDLEYHELFLAPSPAGGVMEAIKVALKWDQNRDFIMPYRVRDKLRAALSNSAPGHTDLMVSPESIDAFLKENPLPAPVPMERGWKPDETWRWGIGAYLRKHSGSWWEGRVVGFYSTPQTPRGYAVQLPRFRNKGPVQIFPEAAFEEVK